MATPFLQKKWRKLFQAFDVTKDNLISMDDAYTIADCAIRSTGVKGKAADTVRTLLNYSFKEFFLKDAEKITEEEMVQRMTKEYNANKTYFMEDVRTLYGLLIRVMDLNGDGKISKKEYQTWLNAFGIFTHDDKYFNAYPQNKDETIPIELFIQGFVEYICNSDEQNVSQMEKARLYAYRVIDDI